LRQRRGITLKRLAQLSGLSDRFIIDVEKGHQPSRCPADFGDGSFAQ
jgi:transcriptional regulator with XRE-family HTH domain